MIYRTISCTGIKGDDWYQESRTEDIIQLMHELLLFIVSDERKELLIIKENNDETEN